MLTTNRQDFKKELEEVIYMFTTGSDIEVAHEQTANGFNYKDVVFVNGNTFSIENFHEPVDELDKKRYEKRFSKLAIYTALSNFYDIKLPWGALTGIRPVKMARDIGKGFEEQFEKVFGVSKKKTELVREIIKNQCLIYDRDGEHKSLFIGIPFCPSKCAYCSFASQIISKSKCVNEYTQALVKEILSLKGKLSSVRSVYVGGGTPVCLPDENLEEILSAVKSVVKEGIEFTVEAGRPDVITESNLSLMKEHGVTRICVNPQTFLDKTLKLIGRNHTASDVLEKYALAKSFGFDINLDVIAGLEGETVEDFKNTVDTAISLGADNITVHTLCLKRGAELKLKTERLDVRDIDEMIDYSYKALTSAGYRPYYLYRQKYAAGNLENTGYSKKGKECIYNVDVMEENSDNPACGANAVSKRVFNSENRIERCGSPKDIVTYIEKVDKIIAEKEQFFK
ncbi:MAG: coproporphyrinogen dehydrogenase HemZ [Clostridiales bacterium]|nr:coproporphyrinogen dehydrogenase HemZ [Clostridiales bacterium]